jgi:hypothetical protein
MLVNILQGKRSCQVIINAPHEKNTHQVLRSLTPDAVPDAGCALAFLASEPLDSRWYFGSIGFMPKFVVD